MNFPETFPTAPHSTPQSFHKTAMWVCLKMSCTPLYPMVNDLVLLIMIPSLAISLGILTQHFQPNPDYPMENPIKNPIKPPFCYGFPMVFLWFV